MKKLLFFTLLIVLSFPLLTNAQYYFNRAYSFTGATGTYAVTDPGANLSLTGSFTVECWVNPTNVATPSYQILVQKRLGSAATGYTLYLSTGKVCIRTNSSSRLTGTTIIPNNSWSHVAATYSSSTGVFTVYVNGVADGTVTVASAAPAADTDSLRFAAGFNSPYAGLMDEIRVWNVELSAADLLARMRIPIGENSGVYAGLVGAWRGNDINGGSGIDEINGYTAYLRGASAFVPIGDKPCCHIGFNTAVKFSGAAGTYIAAPHASALNITGSFTLECWVNPTNVTTPSAQILIQKRMGSTAAGYTMYLSAGKVCIRTNSTTRLTGTTVIPNNVWSHVAATYNSSTNVFTVYVNGTADGTVTTASAAPAADTDSLRLAAGFNSPYAGLMDEVRISNYAKSTDELQKYLFTSLDANNKPVPANVNISYSFEGTLNGTDNSSRGVFRGDAQFTKVLNNSTEPPAPLNRFDAGNFVKGYNIKCSNMTFGASPITITDSMYFSQSLTISDINVFVAAQHTYAADIKVTLKNPSGATSLILYPGGNINLGMHMVTIFDDQADSVIGGTITAPFSPRVKPTNALSVFNSQNSSGWWKIIITDIFPSSDDGKLMGWGIQFNNQVITGSQNYSTITPGRFYLHQNYPNPFNPVTSIKYEVAKNVNVKIIVYDILGKEIRTLVNEFKKAGVYTVELNATNMSSGVYFYKISTGEYNDVKKMMLIK
jgi:subtilisin-like proprotein convertase family protein